MKRKNIISILICVALLVCGCARCIDKKQVNVQVKIVEEYHRKAYTTLIPRGKSMAVINHPKIHRITVEYDGDEYSIDDAETYKKYKKSVGKMATAILETKIYDDGTEKRDVIKLK